MWSAHPHIPPTSLGVYGPALRTFFSTVISLLTCFSLPLCLFESDPSLAKAFPCSEVSSQPGIPRETPEEHTGQRQAPGPLAGTPIRAEMGKARNLAKGKESLPYLHPLPTSHHPPPSDKAPCPKGSGFLTPKPAGLLQVPSLSCMHRSPPHLSLSTASHGPFPVPSGLGTHSHPLRAHRHGGGCQGFWGWTGSDFLKPGEV